MKTLLMSYWRNDEHRQMSDRIGHLLAKVGIDKWLWVVGDSSDRTEEILREWEFDPRVCVLRADTGLTGEDLQSRRLRISATETLAYAALADFKDIDWVIQHESDLRTSMDVAAQLLTHANENTAVAGWPTLFLGNRVVFYDIWAYRGLDGMQFGPHAPYHRDYRSTTPFEVGSFGSVWMARRTAWVNRVIQRDCCVELCAQWRAEGMRLVVDPRIAVQQPGELWVMS